MSGKGEERMKTPYCKEGGRSGLLGRGNLYERSGGLSSRGELENWTKKAGRLSGRSSLRFIQNKAPGVPLAIQEKKGVQWKVFRWELTPSGKLRFAARDEG